MALNEEVGKPSPSKEFYSCVAYLVLVGCAKVTLAVPAEHKDHLLRHAREALGPNVSVHDVARWDLGGEDPGKWRLVFMKAVEPFGKAVAT